MLYFYLLVNHCSSKAFLGVEGEAGTEGRDDGNKHLVPRQQPGPDDREK